MGNGGGGGGHANSNLYKRDRVGADCNWTTHFLMGLTVLVRLMVKGWPELKISNGPPNALTDPALPEHPDTGSQSEYLKKFVLVKLTVATLSNLGVVNGFVLTMVSLASNLTLVHPCDLSSMPLATA
jgi:hypothetical protein